MSRRRGAGIVPAIGWSFTRFRVGNGALGGASRRDWGSARQPGAPAAAHRPARASAAAGAAARRPGRAGDGGQLPALVRDPRHRGVAARRRPGRRVGDLVHEGQGHWRRAQRPGRDERDLYRRPGRHRQSARHPAQHSYLLGRSGRAGRLFPFAQLELGFLGQAEPRLPRCPHAEPLWRGQGLYRVRLLRPRTPTRSSTTTRAASTATSRASARAMPPSAACWRARRKAPSPTTTPIPNCSISAARRRRCLSRARRRSATPIRWPTACRSRSRPRTRTPTIAGPFGTFFTDTNQIPESAACAALTTPAIDGTATGTATIGGTTVATNITNACLGNAAFFNPSQDIAPILSRGGGSSSPGAISRRAVDGPLHAQRRHVREQELSAMAALCPAISSPGARTI